MTNDLTCSRLAVSPEREQKTSDVYRSLRSWGTGKSCTIARSSLSGGWHIGRGRRVTCDASRHRRCILVLVQQWLLVPNPPMTVLQVLRAPVPETATRRRTAPPRAPSRACACGARASRVQRASERAASEEDSDSPALDGAQARGCPLSVPSSPPLKVSLPHTPHHTGRHRCICTGAAWSPH